MRLIASVLFAFLIAAPLYVSGCKKKEAPVTEAPVTAPQEITNAPAGDTNAPAPEGDPAR